jgi:hypothetical protein
MAGSQDLAADPRNLSVLIRGPYLCWTRLAGYDAWCMGAAQYIAVEKSKEFADYAISQEFGETCAAQTRRAGKIPAVLIGLGLPGFRLPLAPITR